jgi:hypothetical protein
MTGTLDCNERVVLHRVVLAQGNRGLLIKVVRFRAKREHLETFMTLIGQPRLDPGLDCLDMCHVCSTASVQSPPLFVRTLAVPKKSGSYRNIDLIQNFLVMKFTTQPDLY